MLIYSLVLAVSVQCDNSVLRRASEYCIRVMLFLSSKKEVTVVLFKSPKHTAQLCLLPTFRSRAGEMVHNHVT